MMAAADSSNGAYTGDMLDLSALVAEIESRLVITGSVPLEVQSPPAAVTVEREQALVFQLGPQLFAIEVAAIDEIVPEPSITRIPGLVAWVAGVTNWHGDVISVVNLAMFLNIDRAAMLDSVSMIVAHADDQRIGLLVDAVDTIYTYSMEAITSPPFTIDPALVAYLRGAVERDGEYIKVLDGRSLLLGPQMQQFR